jgi:hypothetical protein
VQFAEKATPLSRFASELVAQVPEPLLEPEPLPVLLPEPLPASLPLSDPLPLPASSTELPDPLPLPASSTELPDPLPLLASLLPGPLLVVTVLESELLPDAGGEPWLMLEPDPPPLAGASGPPSVELAPFEELHATTPTRRTVHGANMQRLLARMRTGVNAI